MGVSKNSGTPKMDGLYIMENPIKTDDLEMPLFSETSLYRNPNFHVIFLSLGGHEKTSQKYHPPKKVTFKLADIPTK